MAFNTLRGHGCANLIRDLEEMFAVLCWVATFAGAPTSKKLTKSLQKFARVYKPGSPIGPAMVWTRPENQIKPINDGNKNTAATRSMTICQGLSFSQIWTPQSIMVPYPLI